MKLCLDAGANIQMYRGLCIALYRYVSLCIAAIHLIHHETRYIKNNTSKLHHAKKLGRHATVCLLPEEGDSPYHVFDSVLLSKRA